MQQQKKSLEYETQSLRQKKQDVIGEIKTFEEDLKRTTRECNEKKQAIIERDQELNGLKEKINQSQIDKKHTDGKKRKQ